MPGGRSSRHAGSKVATASPRESGRGPVVWRIRDRATFEALRRHGQRSRRGPITVTYVVSGDDSVPRVAYAVGKRVGGAVVRNRLRRRLRAVVAEASAPTRTGRVPGGGGPGGGRPPLRGLEGTSDSSDDIGFEHRAPVSALTAAPPVTQPGFRRRPVRAALIRIIRSLPGTSHRASLAVPVLAHLLGLRRRGRRAPWRRPGIVPGAAPGAAVPPLGRPRRGPGTGLSG